MPEPSIPSARSAYLDAVRSFVILLVVAMHSNVTYSGIGGWYYTEVSSGSLDTLSLLVFGFYGSFTQAWFMGLLFFIGGHFAARSLARRGTAPFLRERLFRLGAPLLAYVFLVTPFIAYVLMNYSNVRSLSPLAAYGRYLASLDWIGGTGPLWFVEALLLFTLPYVLFRAVRPRKAEAGPGSGPGALTLLGVTVLTAAAAWAVRIPFPVGTSVANLQLCFFPAYIALFVLGVRSGEGLWLEEFTETWGRRALAVGLGIGIPLWAAVMILGGALEGSGAIYGGGTWQSGLYALWESFTAVSVSVGLLWLFRRRFDRETAVSRFLAENSFAVYFLHAPVLIALSLALRPWLAPPLVKHAAVFPLAYLATLALSAALRRIPPIRFLLR